VSVPAPAYRLEQISPRAFQHPADRAATAALEQIPYLDAVLRRLIQLGYERALRQFSLGAAVRLGERQLPGIWALHREVFDVLDVPEVPDLYMTQFPFANATTFGAGKPVVVINSELVRILDEDRLRPVLAHEAAHVLAEHILYRTALLILLRIGRGGLPALAGLPLMALRAALLEWERAAELSSDRAAAIVTRDPMKVCSSLMTLAAGEAAEELNLDAVVGQAIEYSERGSGLDRLSRIFLQLGLTHPSRCAAFTSCWPGSATATTTGSSEGSTSAAARSTPCARRPTSPARITRTASATSSVTPASRCRTLASSWPIGCRETASDLCFQAAWWGQVRYCSASV